MLANLFSQRNMKKYILAALTASFFLPFSIGFVSAQGDPLAGIACLPGKNMKENESKCSVSQAPAVIKAIIQGGLKIFFVVLTITLVGSLLFDFWSTGASSGSTQFFLNSKKKIGGVVLGLLCLLFMFGGSLDLLRDVGVSEDYLYWASYFLSMLPIDHAYAAGEIKPLIDKPPLEILMNGIKVLWVWVVFPIMIAGWFFAGFKYVAAQGSPEKIKEAHGVLTAIVLVTVFVLFVQGFLSALF